MHCAATNNFAAGAVLTLSGETVVAVNIPAEARAEIIVNQDGTVDSRINSGARVQIDTLTDWIIPNGAAPDDYETRFTNVTGPALNGASSALVNVWRALSLGDFFFVQLDNTPGLGGNVSTFDIEIRKGNSGGALVSASYTLDADRV